MNVLDKMSPGLRELHMAVEFREAAMNCFEQTKQTGEPKIVDCARKLFDAQIAVEGNLTQLDRHNKSDNKILRDGEMGSAVYRTGRAALHAGYNFEYEPGLWCYPSWADDISVRSPFNPNKLSPKLLTFHRLVTYRDLTILRVATDDLWDELVEAEYASIAQGDIVTYAGNLKPTTAEIEYLTRNAFPHRYEDVPWRRDHEAASTLAELNRHDLAKGSKYKKTDWTEGYYGVKWDPS